MSGIMIKTAVYGILRFVLMFLGVQVEWWGIVILVIGIFSSVLGVAYAFAQKNIKKLLAYHSIENIGIIFIGLGIGFIAQANGNHAISSLAIIYIIAERLDISGIRDSTLIIFIGIKVQTTQLQPIQG